MNGTLLNNISVLIGIAVLLFKVVYDYAIVKSSLANIATTLSDLRVLLSDHERKFIDNDKRVREIEDRLTKIETIHNNIHNKEI